VSGAAHPARTRGIAIALYCAAFWALLLLRPIGRHPLMVVDDALGIAGALCALPLAWGWSRRPWLTGGARLWAPRLLGLGALAYAVGSTMWTYNQEVVHQPSSLSWANAGYLVAYPLLFLGILLLPARPLAAAARLRVALDGLMIMTALATVSWYFVLGPTILRSDATAFGKIAAASAPLCDLLLLASVLLLWARAGGALRSVVLPLSLGLLCIVVADSVFDYQSLQGTYIVGEPIDPLWPLGYLLIGLGAWVARRAPSLAGEGAPGDGGTASAARPSLAPYAAIPAMAALAAYAYVTHSDEAHAVGVYLGGAALVALVVMRQILVILENRGLYARLDRAYTAQGRDLAQREHEVRTVVSVAPLILFALDRDGVYTLAEGTALAALGLSPDALYGRSVFDLFPEAVEVHACVRRALAGEACAGRITRAGSDIVLEAQYRPLRADDGTVAGVIGVSVDVTDRARAEEALRESETRFRLVTQLANDAIISIDGSGRIASWNRGAARIYGYAEDEALGLPLTALLPERARAAAAAWAGRAMGPDAAGIAGIGEQAVETVGRHKDGHEVPLELTLSSWTTGSERHHSAVVRDITERKRAEEGDRRRARHAALRADANAALAENITLRDTLQRCAEATIYHLDAALTRIWLLDEDDGTPMLRLQACAGLSTALDGPYARVPLGVHRTGLIAQQRLPYLTNDLRADPHIGANEWMDQQGLVSYAGYPLLVEDRAVGVLALFARQALEEDTLDALASLADAVAQGIERTRAEEALRRQALHDALTDLPNRTLLQDRLTRALDVARRDGRDGTGGAVGVGGAGDAAPVALLLLDLDRFKEVNDTLGHQYGDELLRQVGVRLRETLRASDTVARLGGDEFAALLPGADEAATISAARAVLAALTAPIMVEGQTLDVGASIGVALSPAHGDDATTLLRRADVAMYAAKHAHGGYAIYDEVADRHSADRLALAGALRQALADDGLLLYYQPQVSLATGAVCGVEALLRWPHPVHGFIPPDYFIPLAEHTGLIGPLTEWVLRAALRHARGWAHGGSSLSVAVNLSAHLLHDQELPATIAALLREYGIAPGTLTLEVTESAVMADPERAVDVLARLRHLGVRLSIDDFGTGYSSLGYLKRLPVDEIKIDKSFVLELGTGADPADVAIVRSVVQMAQALRREVVAEGVENPEAWGLLRGLGCDVAQGYYMSRPLPAAELERWLRDSSWGLRRASA